MRAIAKMMLVLWLFGVVAGSANACILQKGDTGSPVLQHHDAK